jgi:hypothetical protein
VVSVKDVRLAEPSGEAPQVPVRAKGTGMRLGLSDLQAWIHLRAFEGMSTLGDRVRKTEQLNAEFAKGFGLKLFTVKRREMGHLDKREI